MERLLNWARFSEIYQDFYETFVDYPSRVKNKSALISFEKKSAWGCVVSFFLLTHPGPPFFFQILLRNGNGRRLKLFCTVRIAFPLLIVKRLCMCIWRFLRVMLIMRISYA